MRTPLALWLILVLFGLAIRADGQELRIYTLTRDVTAEPAAKAPIISRSLTLFHAGKVYDYISELREVTIFEPAHHRFTVLNEPAAAYAMISQDQVRRFLTLAEDRARELAGDFLREDDPMKRQAVELLQFQLFPQFDPRFDTASRQLTLTAPRYAYEVSCMEGSEPQVVERYLVYADALAEFNSVLHPQSFLPGPRLALNQALRDRQVLPVKVLRKVDFDGKQALLAEHEWRWSLTEFDRQLITNWESQIVKGQVRELSFEQMQRAVLTGKLAPR